MVQRARAAASHGGVSGEIQEFTSGGRAGEGQREEEDAVREGGGGEEVAENVRT